MTKAELVQQVADLEQLVSLLDKRADDPEFAMLILRRARAMKRLESPTDLKRLALLVASVTGKEVDPAVLS